MAAETRAADDSGAPEAQADTRWEHLSADHQSAAMENFDVYLDDFISVVHGVPRERRQMICHLLHQIDLFFLPNEESDTNRKDPISRNNLGQEDGAWSTINKFLVWYINTIAHLLHLTPRLQ